MFTNVKAILLILVIGLNLIGVSSFAFVEQMLTFDEKFETAIGIFSSSGRLSETSDEDEQSVKGLGVFGEMSWRRTPWAIRLDTFSTERKTGNDGLSVSNKYREFRAWGIGFTELGEVFSIYGGLGTGILFPETQLSVLGSSRRLNGQAVALGSYILGMRWRFPANAFFDLWSQTVYAPVYPNGNLTSFAMALGYSF